MQARASIDPFALEEEEKARAALVLQIQTNCARGKRPVDMKCSRRLPMFLGGVPPVIQRPDTRKDASPRRIPLSPPIDEKWLWDHAASPRVLTPPSIVIPVPLFAKERERQREKEMRMREWEIQNGYAPEGPGMPLPRPLTGSKSVGALSTAVETPARFRSAAASAARTRRSFSPLPQTVNLRQTGWSRPTTGSTPVGTGADVLSRAEQRQVLFGQQLEGLFPSTHRTVPAAVQQRPGQPQPGCLSVLDGARGISTARS
eukprot:Cvel_7298.t2-p1 / transcript=Cvel_7298.t2 / gene=Cvel_7298 / organism=Chromera_velia_CCMP2878 / gene_product=hypothetical protein / transcript_product=hypothetical protein / location=Cvel_scaffold377:73020-74455(-) / protein_length=258 / sequence_SO=supercontig / SO=protein_coding / is_pseudo=false